MGEWDKDIKRLVNVAPQDIISWLLPGAVLEGKASVELLSRKILADDLYWVRVGDELYLLHIEFQSSNDSAMAERLLEYNVLATRMHKRRVISCVIYLVDDGEVPGSPLIWRGPGNETLLLFAFLTVKLWEMTAEALLALDLPGVLPFLPLTKGGKRSEIIDHMITGIWESSRLAPEQKKDLLGQAFSMATLVFKDMGEKEWLRRRFAMHGSILRQSWAYQEWKKEGVEEGLKEGVANTLLAIVEARFPALLEQAKQRVADMQDVQALQRLVVNVSIARTAEEAAAYLQPERQG